MRQSNAITETYLELQEIEDEWTYAHWAPACVLRRNFHLQTNTAHLDAIFLDNQWQQHKQRTTRTTTRSCRTRKRAFHFHSPGVIRRSRVVAAARTWGHCCMAAAAAAAGQEVFPWTPPSVYYRSCLRHLCHERVYGPFLFNKTQGPMLAFAWND